MGSIREIIGGGRVAYLNGDFAHGNNVTVKISGEYIFDDSDQRLIARLKGNYILDSRDNIIATISDNFILDKYGAGIYDVDSHLSNIEKCALAVAAMKKF